MVPGCDEAAVSESMSLRAAPLLPLLRRCCRLPPAAAAGSAGPTVQLATDQQTRGNGEETIPDRFSRIFFSLSLSSLSLSLSLFFFRLWTTYVDHNQKWGPACGHCAQ